MTPLKTPPLSGGVFTMPLTELETFVVEWKCMKNLKYSLAIVLLVGFFVPVLTKAQTATSTADLEATMIQLQEELVQLLLTQIEVLQTKVVELQEQIVAATPDTTSPTSVESIFTETLQVGSTGEDVTLLQEFLAQDPDVYPEGLVTGYFGPLTEAAVQRFQEKNNIVSSGNPESTGYGLVGPLTRETLNTSLGETNLFVADSSSGELTIVDETTLENGLANGEIADYIEIDSTTTSTSTPTAASALPPIETTTPPREGETEQGDSSVATTTPTPEPETDIIPPDISGIQVTNITETSAIISWTTNEAADSKITYFPHINPTPTTDVTDSNFTTSHSLNLSGLSIETLYYYMITSVDGDGNSTSTTNRSFITTGPPKACGDGLDNDNDGFTDLSDPGCLSVADDDETDPPPPLINTNSIEFENSSGENQYLWLDGKELQGLALSGDMTIEAWISVESDDISLNTILSKYGTNPDKSDNYKITWQDVDAIPSSINEPLIGQVGFTRIVGPTKGKVGTVLSNSPPYSQNRDTWIHVAASYGQQSNGGYYALIYLNGVEQERAQPNISTGCCNGNIFGDADLNVGANREGTIDFFDGKIDELRIWDKARYRWEIVEDYNKELVGNEPNLIGYWKFNGDLNDSSISGNHLMNNGAQFSSDTPF